MWNRRNTIAIVVAGMIPTLLLGAFFITVITRSEEIDQLLYGHRGAKVVVSTISQVTPPAAPTVIPAMPTLTPTPIPTVDIKKRYAPYHRVLDRPPVTIINGIQIAPYGNLEARYLESKHQGGEVQITVQCPLNLWKKMPTMQHALCGVVVDAYVDGIRLDDHDFYYNQERTLNYGTFYLPNTRSQEHVLAADIYVYPNMIYQAHWKLVPDEETPIGPLELATTMDEFAKAVTQVTFSKEPINVKTGVGHVSIPDLLRPYLWSIYAVEPQKEATLSNLFSMKVSDDFRFSPLGLLLPGTYEMVAVFEVPNTRKGGHIWSVDSPRTKVLWVK